MSRFVKEQLGDRVIELMVADGGEKSQKAKLSAHFEDGIHSTVVLAASIRAWLKTTPKNLTGILTKLGSLSFEFLRFHQHYDALLPFRTEEHEKIKIKCGAGSVPLPPHH